MLSLICPELGVTPLVDPGTDLEDGLPTTAASPVTADHGAAPLSAQADVDVELDRVFENVGTLPAMVTPMSDPEGGLIVTAAGYPVSSIPGVSVVMTQPLVVTSPAGPTDVDPAIPRPSTGSVGCSSVLPSLPGGVHAGGEPGRPGLLPWTSVFCGLVRRSEGSRRDALFLLTPRPTGAFPHIGESGADGGGGGARVSQIWLERALLMFTRNVCTRVHRRTCSMAGKGVNSG